MGWLPGDIIQVSWCRRAQKCEEDAQRLPAEIEAHQAQAEELTAELVAAEAEVERLTEECRPERESLTKKQQV